MYCIRMRDSGSWLGELFTWKMILLVMQWQTVSCIKGPSEVVVPGAGHVQRLPHSLKPPLQETRSVLFYHRYPRDGSLKKGGNRQALFSSPDNFLRIKTWSSIISSQEHESFSTDSVRPSMRNLNNSDSRHISRGRDEKMSVDDDHPPRADLQPQQLPSNSSQSRQRRDHSSSHNNVTDIKNVTSTNVTVILNGSESKGISDKEIVIIVVCAAIGLVIFFLLTALVAKFYWHKMRDDGSGYQGVLQKDISDGNSPCIDEQMDIQITSKEKDARIHSNMFAQIDEIDEDNCSVSPATKSRRHSALQNNIEGGEGETKPLLPGSIPALPPNLEDSDGRLSELGAVEDNLNEKKDDYDDDQDPTVGTEPGSAVMQGTAEVHVEATAHPVERDPEPRLYYRTGLSQSDYSLSSFTSVNPSYRYGNQVGYMAGYYGYPSGDVVSPESGDYADDQMLLPPPADFDLQPLHFEVPLELADVPRQGSQVASVARNEDSSAGIETSQDLDEVLSNSEGQLTDPDKESDFSLGVNADDGDVVDCSVCDGNDDGAPVAAVADVSNGVCGTAAVECNGKTETLREDGIGPSTSLPVKINTDSKVLYRSNASKSGVALGDATTTKVSATMATDDESARGDAMAIKSENNSNSIQMDGNSIAVT